eukprot:TRINITY_DN9661_c0_g1_i1.p1 TRINITY_DN9661_c0_g1~~TRINITY_DN9661_c0_g1_i1.p1  ORF type:complete len:318 (+),score=36.78 TRINITY_DN9661_c0_g1_i1:185-1138(+)
MAAAAAPPTERRPRSLVVLASGSAASGATTIFFQPLDLIRTRLQVQKSMVSGDYAYRSGRDAFVQIWKREGLLGFYSGVVPNVAGSAISWGLYFLIYESFKSFFQKRMDLNQDGNRQLGMSQHFVSGMGAGIIVAALTNPIWVIKTRILTQVTVKNGKTSGNYYNGALHAVKRIIAEEGVAGLYRGLGVSLLSVVHGAIHFTLYEKIKSEFLQRGVEHLHTGHWTIAGLISKTMATLMAYPLQVIKSNIQMRRALVADKESIYQKTFAKETVKKIWRTQGIRGFYQGIFVSIVRTAPTSTVMFILNEKIRGALDKTV